MLTLEKVKGLFKTYKIDLTAYIGESAFIEIREPTTEEYYKMINSNSKEAGDAIKKLFEVLPDMLVNHSWPKETSNKELVDTLYNNFIIATFIDKECGSFFTQRVKEMKKMITGSRTTTTEEVSTK